MTETNLPARIMRRFVETLSLEIGHETFSAVLSKASLPEDWAHSAHFIALDDARTALAYSRLQSALRTYYGRGARGILLRIGAKLWNHVLDDSSLGHKAQAALIRGLPKSLRRKPALELLASILSGMPGNVTVHTLDLLLADGQEHDIEERACRALGARQCEFKITIGG